MFHRAPSISVTSVVVLGVVLLLTMLAASLSSPGAAHADHSSPPTVKIKSVTPDVGEEGRNLRVTLELSRPLTGDEKFCYRRSVSDGPEDRVCIEGGIQVWDSYNDHLPKQQYESGGTTRNYVDEMIKFVFFAGETEKRLSVAIVDDKCITPDRSIRIRINTIFDVVDDYGYYIDTTEETVRISGNDTTQGRLVADGGKCKEVSGTTEEIVTNNAPYFSGLPRNFSVDENTESGEDVGTAVTATDPDTDDTLTYSLVGTDASHFDIDDETGQIETLGALDYETRQTYHLAVSVNDGKDVYGESDSGEDDSIDVTINVTDVNEPPVFDANAPTSLSVEEGTATDTDIGSPITATDPDAGDTVAYSLDTGDGAAFEIDGSTGQIKTKDALDSETKNSYSVTITATDSGSLTDTHAVTITVGDVNDTPTFEDEQGDVQTSTTREIAENTAAGTNIGAPVTATDDDTGDTLTYSLGGTDSASFDIEGSTGQIKTKAALDYEGSQNSYSVTVSVTDSKDDSGNAENPAVVDASIDVTINVTDVNEGPAFAADAPATLSVDEGTGRDTNITDGLFTATDPENDSLTYSLGGTDAADFAIDTSTGQLKTRSVPHHETRDSYSITIQVTDGKAADGTTETTATIDDTHAVTINVNEVAEWDLLRLDKVARVGAPVNAGLLDRDRNFEINPTWEWEISPNGTDQWEGATAGTTVNNPGTSSYTPAQADLGKYLRVTVTYEAADATSKTLSKEVPRPIVGNNAPGFGATTDTREVAENTKRNQLIGAPVTATDVDTDSGDELTYSLGGTDASSFNFDTTSGQLKTKAALDHEEKDSYTVTVTATDLARATDTIDVTITVTDVNEKPEFDASAPATQTVDENTAADTAIGDAYTGTDEDESETLTYGITGTDAASFAIDTATGQLKTKAALDHETKDSYSVTVTVSDGRNDAGTAEAPAVADTRHDVTITITDVDEDGTLTLDSEHPRIGATLTATLSDEDDGHANIEWEWESSSDGNDPWTAITDATSSSYTPVEDDEGDHLRVTVTYDDTHDTGHTITEQADNAVVANNAPDFGATTATRSVAENTPAGRNIGAPVTATDSDTGDTLTYSLSGTDASSFGIVSTSGQLQTKAALDYETETSYSVVVTATDTATATDTITVTINVTDVNESPVNNGGGNGGGGNGGGGNGGNGGGNGGNGGGNGGNGGNNSPPPPPLTPLTPPTPPENTRTNVVNNVGNTKVDTTPANSAPVFTDGASTVRSIPERSATGTSIGTAVSATDADGDDLTYSMAGTDAGSFSINTGTGQISTRAALDFEVKNRYSVSLSVSDGKGGTDTIAVTIRVTDATDVAVVNEDTQVVAVINPGGEQEVTTPDDAVTATFPAGTRPSTYIVSIDSSLENCDWSTLETPPAENLHGCVTLVVYDTQGNVIGGSGILSPAISITFTISADDVGDNTIVAFAESGGTWSSVTVTTSTDDDGNITVTISGVSGPGTFAVGSNASQQTTQVVAPPTPTPQPTIITARSTEPVIPAPAPRPAQQNTPTPTPPPTPTSTPTSTPTPTAVPTPTPQPTPQVLEQSAMLAPPSIEDLGNASQLEIPQVSFSREAEGPLGDLRLWPVILLALGIAMELVSLGLFLKEKEADKRRF